MSVDADLVTKETVLHACASLFFFSVFISGIQMTLCRQCCAEVFSKGLRQTVVARRNFPIVFLILVFRLC